MKPILGTVLLSLTLVLVSCEGNDNPIIPPQGGSSDIPRIDGNSCEAQWERMCAEDYRGFKMLLTPGCHMEGYCDPKPPTPPRLKMSGTRD